MKKELAIIYCRVASIDQKGENLSLDNQIKKCKKYAEDNGYTIEKIFVDRGASGIVRIRPALDELMEYIRQNRHKKFVLISESNSVIARNCSILLNIIDDLDLIGTNIIVINLHRDGEKTYKSKDDHRFLCKL